MKLLLAVVTAIGVAAGPAYPAWADHQSGAQDDHQKAGRDEDRERGALKGQDQRQIQQGEDQLRDKGKAAEGKAADQKASAGQQQITGKVQSARGDTIVVKADDGRTLNVNIAQIDPKIREVVRANESVTVLGVISGDQMVAHVIQGGVSGEGSALPRDAAGEKPADSKQGDLDKQDLNLNKKGLDRKDDTK